MQLNANVPGDLVYIIQALVLFSIAAEFLPAIQRAWSKRSTFQRRTAPTNATITGIAENGTAQQGLPGTAPPEKLPGSSANEGASIMAHPSGEGNSSQIEED